MNYILQRREAEAINQSPAPEYYAIWKDDDDLWTTVTFVAGTVNFYILRWPNGQVRAVWSTTWLSFSSLEYSVAFILAWCTYFHKLQGVVGITNRLHSFDTTRIS
jgi:hypothetical protein